MKTLISSLSYCDRSWYLLGIPGSQGKEGKLLNCRILTIWEREQSSQRVGRGQFCLDRRSLCGLGESHAS